MSLPGVTIEILNGQLGQVDPSEDGTAGLIMTGASTGSIALGETKLVTSVAEAEALGLNAAYDTTNTTNVYKNIVDFFNEAGEGSELYINIIAKTNLMAATCDITNNLLKKLLNDAGGRIRLIAVTRVPDGGYTPSYTGGIDADTINALPKIHALAVDFRAQFKPFRWVIDGRDFQGTVSALGNLKSNTYNTGGVVLFTDVSGSDNASVGLVLGRLAHEQVQRNLGRVKSGAIGRHSGTADNWETTDPITNAYLTGQSTLISALSLTDQGSIHDKGYIFARQFISRTGWYFNDDPTAAPASDDFNSIARGRVIDKAILITNEVYTEEIQDDIDIDENGRIDAGVIKDYQSKIKKEIDARMTLEGEISGSRVVMDPRQNVLSTNKVKVQLFIRPKGYNKEIAVTLAFENPANA